MIPADSVRVDEHGHIWLGELQLFQRDAIEVAAALAQAVEDSINRSQKKLPRYYDSKAILERQESKLGKAISALRKVYS